MVHSSGRVLLEELGDGGLLPERLQELELGVFELDKHDGHSVLRQGLGGAHLRQRHMQGPGVVMHCCNRVLCLFLSTGRCMYCRAICLDGTGPTLAPRVDL